MHVGHWENNGKNNATAVGLCAVFVVSWWRNKGLHTLNRMHNEVWGCVALRALQYFKRSSNIVVINKNLIKTITMLEKRLKFVKIKLNDS